MQNLDAMDNPINLIENTRDKGDIFESTSMCSQSSDSAEFGNDLEDETASNPNSSQNFEESFDEFSYSEEKKNSVIFFKSSSCNAVSSENHDRRHTHGMSVNEKYKTLHCGYLMKLGGTGFTPKNWRKRWFVLRSDNCLYYYKKEEEKPLGAIILLNYLVTSFVGSCNQKNVFQLTKGGARFYTFAAFSEAEMKMWMQLISESARPDVKMMSSPGFSVHNVGIPALSIVDPDCHGYIWKRGEIHKTWKRRYAVLKDGSLYYYKEMADTTAIGLFCLHNYHVNETESIGRKYSIIAIPPEPHWRTYYFSTETENDRLRWTRCLQSSIDSVCAGAADFHLNQLARHKKCATN